MIAANQVNHDSGEAVGKLATRPVQQRRVSLLPVRVDHVPTLGVEQRPRRQADPNPVAFFMQAHVFDDEPGRHLNDSKSAQGVPANRPKVSKYYTGIICHGGIVLAPTDLKEVAGILTPRQPAEHV